MLDILGHKVVLDFFEKVRENNKLSHAYCFIGPKNVGKFTIAKFLATQLLGLPKEKLFTSPDLFLLEQIIKQKTGKLGKDISIDQVRELVSFLSRHAFLGGYKVAVIDNADLLSVGASNALLKTLEEPKSKAIIFLVTDDEKKLLPTILSRCQIIYFSTISQDLIQDFLDKSNLSREKKDYILKYSCGLPGIAVKLATDEDYYLEYTKEVRRFEGLFGRLFYEKLKMVEELFGDKKDHIQARNYLRQVLYIWQINLHIFLKNNKLDKTTTLNLYNSITKANNLLIKNVHPRLLIENILLQIP
ncbi:MAG: hypothetical protein COY69_03415 [Candidatus Magasanikbacteria bacterium CG_4_10_14_0_8_um_filter_32_14]|uniref:AAA+ ATPase domain-containing protein n=1 Tax=Candidatus Magasanikbacteria bacterium CG_4_10_14_0_8_um_filter_32_14 TaxID=1974640 RepID=A0A2M7R959_9BACT|nr:MAG: hypothetical protein COY69_03415 [Candidatus Magasanikbacteria bacterium CG_4_10_14_0_8_um_filter_32_14]